MSTTFAEIKTRLYKTFDELFPSKELDKKGENTSPLIPKKEIFLEDLDHFTLNKSNVEMLPKHHQVWVCDFVIPVMEYKEDIKVSKKKAAKHIKHIMAIFRAFDEKKDKILTIQLLYSYMAKSEGAIYFMMKSKQFAKTVRIKTEEFGEHKSNLFKDCDEITKKFLYSISGKWY